MLNAIGKSLKGCGSRAIKDKTTTSSNKANVKDPTKIVLEKNKHPTALENQPGDGLVTATNKTDATTTTSLIENQAPTKKPRKFAGDERPTPKKRPRRNPLSKCLGKNGSAEKLKEQESEDSAIYAPTNQRDDNAADERIKELEAQVACLQEEMRVLRSERQQVKDNARLVKRIKELVKQMEALRVENADMREYFKCIMVAKCKSSLSAKMEAIKGEVCAPLRKRTVRRYTKCQPERVNNCQEERINNCQKTNSNCESSCRQEKSARCVKFLEDTKQNDSDEEIDDFEPIANSTMYMTSENANNSFRAANRQLACGRRDKTLVNEAECNKINRKCSKTIGLQYDSYMCPNAGDFSSNWNSWGTNAACFQTTSMSNDLNCSRVPQVTRNTQTNTCCSRISRNYCAIPTITAKELEQFMQMKCSSSRRAVERKCKVACRPEKIQICRPSCEKRKKPHKTIILKCGNKKQSEETCTQTVCCPSSCSRSTSMCSLRGGTSETEVTLTTSTLQTSQQTITENSSTSLTYDSGRSFMEAANTCQHCNGQQLPVVTHSLSETIATLIADARKGKEVALTVMLETDKLYHVNVSMATGSESLGCFYATEEAIDEAHSRGVFEEYITYFQLDGM